MSEELTEIENNLALIIALETSKVSVMNELARCFKQLTVINTSFQESSDVWRDSAIESGKAIQTMMGGIEAFDADGKIRSFLEQHVLNPIWMVK